MAAPGHLGSHRLAVATLARAQKAQNLSNAVLEAAAPPVPLDVLALFVFRLLRHASFFPDFLEMLLFSHQTIIHSSQQLGLDQKGEQERLFSL